MTITDELKIPSAGNVLSCNCFELYTEPVAIPVACCNRYLNQVFPEPGYEAIFPNIIFEDQFGRLFSP